MKNKGDNFLVLLRSGDVILKILAQKPTAYQAKWFVKDNYPDFDYESPCQYSKFKSPEFITIETTE